MAGQPLDFFISYTASDEDWATWAAQRLELAGYRVVLQAWDFGDGNFIAKIEDAVQRAEWLLPILSEPYLRSKWGRGEWTAYYKDIGRPNIIPIQIEDISTRSMLRALVRINLIGLEEQEAEKKLLAKIKEHARPPRHDPLDRLKGGKCSFPRISYSVSVDTGDAQDSRVTQGPTVPIDRDRIQLPALAGEIDDAIGLIQVQVEGPRRDQWWAWADLGLVCHLGRRVREARGAYEHFRQAGSRRVDYQSVLAVLSSLEEQFSPLDPELAAELNETIQSLESSSSEL